jgi:hypothetical protein
MDLGNASLAQGRRVISTNQALTPQAQHHLAATTLQHIQMDLLVRLGLPGGSVRDHAVRETTLLIDWRRDGLRASGR